MFASSMNCRYRHRHHLSRTWKSTYGSLYSWLVWISHCDPLPICIEIFDFADWIVTLFCPFFTPSNPMCTMDFVSLWSVEISLKHFNFFLQMASVTKRAYHLKWSRGFFRCFLEEEGKRRLNKHEQYFNHLQSYKIRFILWTFVIIAAMFFIA